MVPVSIVIITKNEAEVIASCVEMARLITDDIVIIDNGSSDDTLHIAAGYGCRIYQNGWRGYGANKNIGIDLAKYDWILSLDADEVADLELVQSLHKLQLIDAGLVYDIRFRSYFGKKQIRFGHWGRDHHIRLFNRKMVRWSEPVVHETLVLSKQISKRRIKGYLHHYSVKDIEECKSKALYYARLSAESYFNSGKRSNLVNLFLTPAFSFFSSYILRLGFLDGRDGWNISKVTFRNKWLKYRYLNRMEQNHKKSQFVKNNFTVEY